jgi:hypothetical protein
MTDSQPARPVNKNQPRKNANNRGGKNGAGAGRGGNPAGGDNYRPQYDNRPGHQVCFKAKKREAREASGATQARATQALEEQLHRSRLGQRRQLGPSEERKQVLLQQLEEEHRDIELLELKARLREARERKRELLEAARGQQTMPLTPDAQLGAFPPGYQGTGVQAPVLQGIAHAQPALTPHIAPTANFDDPPPPRIGARTPPWALRGRARVPHFEDRDAPRQYGQVVDQLLDYDGYNNEATRYGGGYKPSRSGPEQVAAAPAGQTIPLPQPQIAAEVKPKGKVNKQVLQQRLQRLRVQAPTPVTKAPAPEPLQPPMTMPPLPAGVIPGIGPEWREYMDAFYAGADV